MNHSPDSTRYVRQMVLPEVGEAGQQRLIESSALIVGLGALGSAAAAYLVAAGVGRITLIDGDTVDVSNLHRQILHGESWIGRPKTDSALDRLRETNPYVRIDVHQEFLTAENARESITGHDIIVDGSDNFPTRFLCNDAGFFLRVPVVHASILRFEGQAAVFAPHLGGPCYRCLFPAPPAPASVPSCAEAGVFGALAGMMGSLQAMEAIKCLLGIGTTLTGRITHYNALHGTWREMKLPRDPACPLCGTSPSITKIQQESTTCPDTHDLVDIQANELAAKRTAGWQGLLLDVREPWEHQAGAIPGSTLIPLGSIADQFDHLREHPQISDGIIVYCARGGRSAIAARQLIDAGLPVIGHLAGGYSSWEREMGH